MYSAPEVAHIYFFGFCSLSNNCACSNGRHVLVEIIPIPFDMPPCFNNMYLRTSELCFAENAQFHALSNFT